MNIAIAGNIGSGKTTLATLLARHYGWLLRTEPVVDNPYLADYYTDIARWAFHLEVFFLKERFKTQLAILRDKDTPSIQDRTIYEGVYVFAANNYAQGQLSLRDYATYMALFEQMTTIVQYPDMLLYLRASIEHLVANIQRRGRGYEQIMPLDYLRGLNNRYDDFIYHQYKGRVMVIDVDNMDYEHNEQDFYTIVDRIDATLFGLFST